jgi:hypothetical protein
MAAIGRYILAERRHFKGLFPGEQGYGPMLEPGRYGAKARRFRPRHDRLRQKSGGKIDFEHRPAEQRIAQGASDNPGFFLLMSKRGKNAQQGLITE